LAVDWRSNATDPQFLFLIIDGVSSLPNPRNSSLNRFGDVMVLYV
jgi:hypothetical protein